MKLTSAIVLAIALAAGTATATAEAKTKPETKKADCKSHKTTCSKCAKAKTQVRTGSHIPQKLDGNPRIGSGTAPLIIITSDDIQRGGYSSVLGALTSQGLRR